MKKLARFGAGVAVTAALFTGTAAPAFADTAGLYSSKAACVAEQNKTQKLGYYISRPCYDNTGLFVVWAGLQPIGWAFDYKWMGM
ncbi:hypothetical protein [Leifsonia shinshuensis]|uniref:Secreted protein n=1 Tax=Leifsonia shinshuensis TaxID=150026 RepID=A0A7G6Y5V8_9MICO|nr:hypothetical protein [Leifsonia shinshuensis]QNE33873.1 hypothetical protein F1C12_01080 [Leifsonia shinshuensis]